MFAIEELARSCEAKASRTRLFAVLIAGIVPLALVSDQTCFGQPRLTASPGELLHPAAAIGIVGGLPGGFHSMSLRSLSAATRRLSRRRLRPSAAAAPRRISRPCDG